MAFAFVVAATAGSGLGQQSESFQIPPPDTASPFGLFGQRVAVDPPWAAIADRPESEVFIYELTPTGWRLTQDIVQVPSSLFGESMAFDGDMLVIGAPYWDYLGERKGMVFVYARDDNVWRLAQELQPDGLRWHDRFGDAVAIEGDVLVVGAPRVDTPGTDYGAVFIYERSSSSWDLSSVVRYDSVSATFSEAYLGASVAVSGEVVVAGAKGTGNSNGEVWVIEREPAGWLKTAVLADPTPTSGDLLGKTVAIFRNTVVAGEGGQSLPGFQYKQGSAIIFERSSASDWHVVQEIKASDGFGNASGSDLFGEGVSMEGDRIVVSAPAAIANGPQGHGAVYVFRRDETGAWPQHEAEVYITSDSSVHLSGNDVDLDDGVVVIGSTKPRGAYVFEVESGITFCAPIPNSSGKPAHLAAVFSLEGQGLLSVHDAPPSTLGAFLVSPTRDETVFQPSPLCLGTGIWRLDPIAPTGSAGVAIHELDFGPSSGLLSGATFYFQYWFEDRSAVVGTFNFSNAVAVIIP